MTRRRQRCARPASLCRAIAEVLEPRQLLTSVSGPATAVEGAPYTLTLEAPATHGIEGWKIDWGDGAIEDLPPTSTAASHTYADGFAWRYIRASYQDTLGTHAVPLISPADPAGALDPSFGADGLVIQNLGGPGVTDRVETILLRPDGKIVTVGSRSPTSNDSDIIIARFTRDGILDYTFGVNGSTVTDLGALQAIPRAAALYADGGILVVGQYSGQMMVLRYRPNGTLDTSFADNGKLVQTLRSHANLEEVSILPDGRFLVVGTVNDLTNSNGIVLFRFEFNGSPDLSFSDDGILPVPPHASLYSTTVNDMAIQADGRILLAGSGFTTDYKVRPILVRVNDDGSVDGSFGTAGYAITTKYVPSRNNAVSIQPGGRIIVAADADLTINGVLTNSSMLWGFTPEGAVDPSFGFGGNIVAYNLDGNWPERINDLLVDEDGSIYTLGTGSWYASPGSPVGGILLTRFTASGRYDSAFGIDGRLRIMAGSAYTDGMSMLIGPGHRMLLAGYTSPQGPNDSLLMRAMIGASGHIQVLNAPPDISLAPPTTAHAGQPVTIDFTIADPGADPILRLNIDWGDGTVEDLNVNAASATHTYNVGQAATIRLTAYDDEDSREVTANLLVEPPLPSLDANGVLHIIGTSAADTIDLSTSGQTLSVLINDVQTDFVLANVKKLDLRAEGGDDAITLGPGVVGGDIDLNKGSPTLTLRSGMDGSVPVAIHIGAGSITSGSPDIHVEPNLGPSVMIDGWATGSLSLDGTDGADSYQILSGAATGAGNSIAWTGLSWLTIDAKAGDDQVQVGEEGTSTNTKAGNITITGGDGDDSVFLHTGQFRSVRFDGQAGDDRLELLTSNYVQFSTFSGGAGNDTAVLVGTSADDAFSISDYTVSRRPGPPLSNNVATIQFSQQAEIENVVVHGLGGDDTFRFPYRPPVHTTIDGGEGFDSLSTKLDYSGNTDFTIAGSILDIDFALTTYKPRIQFDQIDQVDLESYGKVQNLIVNDTPTFKSRFISGMDADSLTINHGTYTITADTPPDDNLAVDVKAGANLIIESSREFDTLHIADGAQVTLPAVQNQIFMLGDLALDPLGRLDIGASTVRIYATPIPLQYQWIRSAFNANPRWSGPGITSSLAGGDRGVTVPLPYGALGSLIRVSWNGNVNGDDGINADDYFAIDSGFLAHPAQPDYTDGDFNYDGRIDADDYFLIDQAFLNQTRPASPPPLAPAPAAPLSSRSIPRAPLFSTSTLKKKSRLRRIPHQHPRP